jgi:hypothetical protein
MTVFAFDRAVLLMSVRTRYTMSNTKFVDESVEVVILASPIRLNMTYFVVK